MNYTQTGSAIRSSLIVIFIICALLAAAVMFLPKGFSDNLAKIGQGSVAVVVTHDKNSLGSQDLMNLLNKVRADYAGKVEFLAVDVNAREGMAFTRQQAVGSAVLVLFGPDGSRQGVLTSRIGEKELRSELDRVLSH